MTWMSEAGPGQSRARCYPWGCLGPGAAPGAAAGGTGTDPERSHPPAPPGARRAALQPVPERRAPAIAYGIVTTVLRILLNLTINI